MKNKIIIRTWMFLTAMLLSLIADAATIDRILVQGYLRKADGTAVNGTETITFVLKNGSTPIKTWSNQSVTVTGGAFSKELTGITAAEITSFAGTAGTVSVTVSSTTGSFATSNLAATLLNGAVPLALQAGSLSSEAAVNTSTGAPDAGKAVLLDSSGLIAANMLPSTGVNANSISSGTVSTSRLDAVATSAGAADAGKVVLLNGSGLIATSMLPSSGVDASTLTTGTLPTARLNAVNTTAGAGDAGKVVLLDSAGVIDSTMLAGKVNAAAMAASSVDLSGTAVTNNLPLSNGGTNANLTAANGGVVYSTASAMAITAAGTSGQVLTSSGAGAPTWSTPTLPSSRTKIYLWEDFFAVPIPTITAATNTLMGKAFLSNAAVTGGTSSMYTADASRSGVYAFQTGTTANQNIGLGFCGSSTGGTLVPSTRFEATSSDSWTFEVGMSVSTIAANTGSWWVGLVSASPSALTTMNGTLTGAFFETLSAAPTTITPYARKTALYTGTPGTVAASTWYNYKITYTGGSPGTIEFFVNDVSVGSTSTATNIADATALCPVVFRRSNTVAAATRVDYMGFTQATGSR